MRQAIGKTGGEGTMSEQEQEPTLQKGDIASLSANLLDLHIEGNKVIGYRVVGTCKFDGKKLKFGIDEAENNQSFDPKNELPAHLKPVRHLEAVKEQKLANNAKDFPHDCLHDYREGSFLGDQYGAEKEVKYSISVQCPTCERNHSVQVHCYHKYAYEKNSDDDPNQTLLQRYDAKGFDLNDDFNIKVLTKVAVEHGLTLEQLVNRIKILRKDRDKQPVVNIIDNLQDERWATEIAQLRTDFEAQISLQQSGARNDLTKLLNEIYGASHSIATDDQIIHIDGSRDGHTELQLQDRQRAEAARSEAERERQMDRASDVTSNMAIISYETSEAETAKLATEADKDAEVSSNINAKIKNRKGR
jgi:hypothetical protein